jgi:uncharacterized protein YebE (UPF0316 family)
MVETVLLPPLIFVARICDVSLGTMRMLAVVRGQRLLAVLMGFFETVIWIFAVSSVFRHLDHLANIVAYAAGFAAGNAVGMWIEAKLALGTQVLSFVSRGAAHAVGECLRFADHSVTTLSGFGKDGPVSICHAILPRRMTKRTIELARQVDPDVVVTVEDVQENWAMGTRSWLPDKLPLGARTYLNRWRAGVLEKQARDRMARALSPGHVSSTAA